MDVSQSPGLPDTTFIAVGGGPYSKVNSTPDVDATYTDTTVTAGQTYFYVAKCVDNKSRPSNEMEATVPKP